MTDESKRPRKYEPKRPAAPPTDAAPALPREAPRGKRPLVRASAQEEADRELMLAIRIGDPTRTADAIKAGANVNLRDRHGMTPLHHAAAGSRACVRVLVKTGECDYLARDAQGRYAFELAIEWARDVAVGRLLAKKQAQQAAARGEFAYIPRTD